MYSTYVTIVLFIVSLYCVYVTRGVTLVNKGYTDIVVTLSPDLPEDKGIDVIEKLQKLLTSASEKLFVATRGGVYISQVKIILPPFWNITSLELDSEVNNVTTELSHRATIRVSSNSIQQYGIRTQQSGECGVQGFFIEIDAEFLLNLEDNTGARLFVRNWAKYRYGVFDEIPLDTEVSGKYFVDRGTCRVTGCYDVHPSYFQNSTTEDKGVLKCDGNENTDDIFHELKPKSSLLFTHEIESMELFCDSQHIPEAPTIHNIFCKEQSVWQIIRKSPDFVEMQKNLQVETTNPVFKFFQEKKSRYVFVIQQNFYAKNIDKMADTIEMSLQMAVELLLPDEVELGMVNFTNAIAETLLPITKLTDKEEERRNLLKKLKLQRGNSAGTSPTAPFYAIAGLERAWKMLDSVDGSETVILITDIHNYLYLPWDVIKKKREICLKIIVVSSDLKDFQYIEFGRDGEGNIVPVHIDQSQNLALGWWNFMMGLLFTMNSPEGYHTRMLMVHNEILTNPKEVKGVFYPKVLKNVTKNVVVIACNFGDSQSWEFYLNGNTQNLFRTYPCVFHKSNSQNEDVEEWHYEAMAKSSIRTFAIAAFVLEEPTKSNMIQSSITNSDTNSPKIFCEINDVGKQKKTKVTANVYDQSGMKRTHAELYDFLENGGLYSGYICTNEFPDGLYTIYATAQIPVQDNSGKMLRTLVAHSGYLVVNEDLVDTAPSRIIDLRLLAVDHETRKIILTFTAPSWKCGNETEQKYKLKYSTDRASFFANEDLENKDLILETKPQREGSQENISVILTDITKEQSAYNIYVGIQGILQNVGRQSETSNIVEIDFRTLSSSTLEPQKPVVTTLSSGETPTSGDDGTGTPEDGKVSSDGNTSNRNLIIITSSSLAAFVLLVLIVNLGVWFYCYKKHLYNRNTGSSFKLSKGGNRNIIIQPSEGEDNDSFNGGFSNPVKVDDGYSDSSSMVYVCGPGNSDHRSQDMVDRRTRQLQPERRENVPCRPKPNDLEYFGSEYCSADCVIHEDSKNKFASTSQNDSIYKLTASNSIPKNQSLGSDSTKSKMRTLNMESDQKTQEPLYAQSSKRKNVESENHSVMRDMGVV